MLFLSHTLPYPPDGGAFIRSYNVLRLLSQQYEIRLLAFDRTGAGGTSLDPSARARAKAALGEFAEVTVVPVPQAKGRLRHIGVHLRSFVEGRLFTHYRYHAERFGTAIRQALAERDWDVIHMDSLDLVRFLPELPLSKVVLTHHNIESELLRDRAQREWFPPFRAYVLRQARLQEEAERFWCPKVRLNITVSERDAVVLKGLAPGSVVETVPNGVDVSEIRADVRSSGEIVCVGGLGWFPNRDALDYLCTEILPLLTTVPPARIVWLGRATVRQLEEYATRYGIQLTGYVDSVLPRVEGATCYVLPFRLGGGSRLKLLEAMAAGRPIVSTSVGAMGVAVEHDRHLIIADTAAQFAAAVEHVLADENLQSRLGTEARRLAESVYDWPAIGMRISEIYGRIA